MMNLKMSQRFSLLKKALLLTFMALIWLPMSGYAQNVVKGVVRDASGNTLPGVSVFVKSTNKGVVTDVDGNFNIKASPKEVLIFSYVGMKSQQVRVGNRTNINVTLADDESTLNDVVVVGYGKAKKQSLTGAVSAIKGDKLLEAPSTNLSSLLGGRLPDRKSVV